MLTRIEAIAERSVPILLALQSILGSLQLLDALNIWYHPTIHRATRSIRFELGFDLVAPLAVLLVLWLGWIFWRRPKAVLFPAVALILYPFFGLEAALSAASLQAVVGGLWILRRLGNYLSWVFLFLGGLEAVSLLHWIVYIPSGLASPLESAARLELDMFHMTAYLAPLLVLPLMFMWILKPLFRWGWREKIDEGGIELRLGVRFSLGSVPLLSRARESEGGVIERRDGGRTSTRILLILFFTVSLGVIAALYPYGSAVNPRNLNVGVDIPHYVRAADIVELDVSQAFKIWGGSRPLIFLAIYGFQRLLGSDVSTAVRFLPVLLNPLLAVSAFFLALEVFGDGWTSVWASFFTVCGFTITVGMYSYFLTNMLGLCLIFLSLGFLFRAMRRSCLMSLATASLLGGLRVFTHPWTFAQYYASAVLTAGAVWYEARKRGGSYGKVRAMLFYLVSLGLAEFLKVLVFRGVGGVTVSSTAVRSISGLPGFWYSSIFSFRLLYGGFMSNLVLLGLAIVGVYLMGRRDVPEVYLRVFMLATSLLFLVGDETIKSRLLYNVPVGMFAAYGFISFLRRRDAHDFKHAFIGFVVLSVVVYLFRSLANLI